MTRGDVALVTEANEAFYRAFEALDAAAMARVWTGREDDVCIHPGRSAIVGGAAVHESWRTIFEHSRPVRIRPVAVQVLVVGDMARVSCVERIEAPLRSGAHAVVARVACTNVFVRTGDGWRMTLHHGSPIAEPRFEAVDDGPGPGSGDLN